MDVSEYISTKEAAAIIGCGYDWIVDQCQAGIIPGAIKFNNTWMIPRAWAEKQPKPVRGPRHRKHPVPTLEEVHAKRHKYQQEKAEKAEKKPRVYQRGPRKDLSGMKFGKWTVLHFAEMRRTNSYWLCRCECGAEHIVSGTNLTRGESRGCVACSNFGHGRTKGALGRTLIQPGDVFGRLTVVERAPTPGGKRGVFWKCRCECGNEVVVWGGSLPRGHTRSCGCLKKAKRARG